VELPPEREEGKNRERVLAIVASGRYSFLITNLQMPGMNGVELQKLLLAQGRRIPSILVTAFPEERMRTRAIEASALGFLSKTVRKSNADKPHR